MITKGKIKMEPKDYIVVKIEGEYAYLRDINDPQGGEVFIALALLPQETDIGVKIHCEMFEYSIAKR